MPFPAHFVDAHHRYWDDARLLFDRERWANADQLYALRASTTFDRENVERHREAAGAIRAMVHLAEDEA